MSFDGRQQLSGLRHGDHLCLLYDDRTEQMEVVIPFLKDGLAAGERCCYIADDQTVEELARALDAAGVDVTRECNRGALRLLTKHDTYLRTGTFDPHAMREYLEMQVEQSLADGFVGLRITGEATWALGEDGGCNRLIEYEVLLNGVFPTRPAVGLCQYNRRRFPPEILRDVLRTHPSIVMRGHVVPNLYYEPAELLLGDCTESERLEWMLQQLEHREVERVERLQAERAARESESQYKTLMEVMLAGVYVCDAPSGKIRYYNHRAVELWGREPAANDSEERFCGSFRLWTPEGAPLPHAATPMADVLNGGSPVRNQEVVIERPDGSRITAMVNIAPITNENGKVTGAVNVFQDVSERNRLFEELRASEERHRTLISAIPAAVYTTDSEGRITLFNEHAAELWARRPKIGEDRWCGSFRIFRPDGTPLPHEECPMAVALREGRCIRGEEILVERPDGKRVYVLPHPEILRDGSGKIVGAINMLVDITDRKRAEETRAFLAAIVQSSDDAIISKSLDGTILSWNAGAERLFGYTAEEAVGASIMLLIPPDRIEEEQSILARLRRGERMDHFETVRVSKGGRHINASLTISPVRDASGRIIAASKVARDITERKLAEQERAGLLEAEQHARTQAEQARQSYQDLVNGLDAIVWEADAQTWKFNFVSRRAEELLGYPIERWLEKPDFWISVIHPEDREQTMEFCRSACEECRDHDFEYRAIAADGRTVWLRDIVYVVRGADGRPQQLRGIMVDVTRTKELERDLQERARQLAEVDRRKDEFLAMLGHELRNPLAPIRTGLEFLHASGIEHESVGLMREQVDYLVHLVDDLLDVARIMRGKISLRKEPVDLVAVAQRAVDTIKPLANERRHQLTVSTPAAVWVSADPVRITQIITNLLNNAAKYTPPGGHIWLTLGQQDGFATISVQDNGIGIDPEWLPNIFEPFTQSEHSHDHSQGGLGIGLTLVRSLVHLHEGGIEAHSDGPGKGSEFNLRLPLLEQVQAKATDSPVEPPAKRRRILIVDDNVSAGRMLRLLLTKLGDHQVDLAHDGPSAIEAIRTTDPDLVLLDIGLPGMDGYEVARRVRENGETSGTLLAALTGFGTSEDRRRSLEAGFDVHLAKPASADDLQNLLRHPKLVKRQTKILRGSETTCVD